ncbi:MAG: alpha/beta hydrolase [Dehalococcoidia bacterium]|nr:alpha/beta hydrolase [Dehalococcoidia bacterium]
MTGETRFAQVNGVRIAYEQHGAGYPLLLLHGHPRDRSLWRHCLPALAQRFSVVAMDRRGYGDSEMGLDPASYDNGAMTLDTLGLADHLGWPRFLVVGHDLSAQVARRLAQDHPDRLLGAGIFDQAPEGTPLGDRRDPGGRQWYFDFFRQRGVAEAIMNDNPRLFFSLFLQRNPHLSPAEHSYFVERFARAGAVESVLADYRARLEVDAPYWAEQARIGARITTPLLVLWGGRGAGAATPMLEAWRGLAGDVRGAPIADAGHYLQEEQPAAVVSHIVAFGDELGAR